MKTEFINAVEPPPQAGSPQSPGSGTSIARIAIRVLLPIAFIAAGAAGAVALVETKPKPKQRKPAKAVTLVEVQPLQRSRQRVVVQAMGTVMPAQQVQLRPQVSGRIVSISVNLAPGGRFAASEEVAQIERKDYELALAQRRADLAQAELNYKVELGRQEIAKREWELHSNGQKHTALDLELALRKPHLAQAKAAIASAKAAVSQADLNLTRTTVRSPFNAILMTKSVDVGSEVTPQTALAVLAGTDEYWIQVSVPVDRLKWLTFPDASRKTGSRALVRMGASQASQARVGHVARLLSDLETQGRMARVLVVVKDALGLQSPGRSRKPLLLGAYVHVAIDGEELRDVISIPRVALRGQDKLWLMDSDNKLAIRQVKVVWRDENAVFVRNGLSDGDRLGIFPDDMKLLYKWYFDKAS